MRPNLIKFLLLTLATPLIAFSGASLASPITYAVSRTITNGPGTNPSGTMGTVSGSITTDGTIGSLTVANVTAWSLALNDGVLAAFTINEGNSTFAFNAANPLVATATQLSFDFGGAGDLLFDNPNQLGNVYWGLEGIGGSLIGAGDSTETVRTNSGSGLWTTQGRSGVQVVAEVGSQGVPEPGSAALVGMALVGLALSRRLLRPV